MVERDLLDKRCVFYELDLEIDYRYYQTLPIFTLFISSLEIDQRYTQTTGIRRKVRTKFVVFTYIRLSAGDDRILTTKVHNKMLCMKIDFSSYQPFQPFQLPIKKGAEV